MSKLLFDEQPLVIDRKLAKSIGLNEAIVLQQVHYWISINKKTNKNFHEGKYWVYNSLPNWHENNFDFWSFDTVKRTFSKLVKAKILITGNFNKDKRDRTLWYTIDYEKLEKLINSKSAKCTDGEDKNTPNASGQNAPVERAEMHRPIPEITTENSSETNNNNNEPNAETIDNMLPVTKNINKDVVVDDDESNEIVKELKPKIDQTVGKISTKQLVKLIRIAGSDAIIKQLEKFPIFKKTQTIMNPVGFFIRAVIEDWDTPVPSKPNRNSFCNFEQHEYTDEELEALFEPIV